MMRSSWGDSITLRSFASLLWRAWMTLRALSVSLIHILAASEALLPVA